MKTDLQIGLWQVGFNSKTQRKNLMGPFSFHHWLTQGIETELFRVRASEKENLI